MRFNGWEGDLRSQEIVDTLKADIPGAEDRESRDQPRKDTRPHDAERQGSSRAERYLG